MDHADLAARFTAALARTGNNTAANAARSDRQSHCSDPGCLKHAGVTDPPPFPTTRRSGAAFGEAVANAWYSCGSNRMDIPTGVVAALALHPTKSPGAVHTRALADLIAAQPSRVLVKGYAEVYGATWMLRPDLMDVAAPILRWTEEDLNDQELRGVAAVTQAALRAGVLQHTGDSDPYFRSDIDLLSWTITTLRHHSARKGLGEYHTPPEITDLMARMLWDTTKNPHVIPAAGDTINEPTAGTGGMCRSMAQAMRDHGLNPHEHMWVMQELDPIAAAGAAVNTIIWDLGPKAVVVVGDTLAEGDLSREALIHQRKMQTQRDKVYEATAFALATRDAVKMLNALTADHEHTA